MGSITLQFSIQSESPTPIRKRDKLPDLANRGFTVTIFGLYEEYGHEQDSINPFHSTSNHHSRNQLQ